MDLQRGMCKDFCNVAGMEPQRNSTVMLRCVIGMQTPPSHLRAAGEALHGSRAPSYAMRHRTSNRNSAEKPFVPLASRSLNSCRNVTPSCQ